MVYAQLADAPVTLRKIHRYFPAGEWQASKGSLRLILATAHQQSEADRVDPLFFQKAVLERFTLLAQAAFEQQPASGQVSTVAVGNDAVRVQTAKSIGHQPADGFGAEAFA